ncbi:alpha/beta hydrolase [Streptosporangium sp. NPDC002524]|uniref:alpha/beta hydrolase n=1 Tax=Streptosporangium sp. NPDC002524 TaxID=3154537 RepID=UPI003332A332
MSFSTRPSRMAVGVLLLLTTLSACSPPAEQQKTRPAQPSAELASFYGQKLAFGPCKDYATTPADTKIFAAGKTAECARLRVPLDYDDPDGETAQIALLRVPARGTSMGSLLLNSGGPGGPGMQFAVLTAAALARNPITERFDLIGFDPRGVAASEPAVDCFTDEEMRGGELPYEFIVSAGSYTEADTRRLAEQCAKRSGGEQALAAISSRDTVRDMDVLRAALGDKQLNFLGQSYGTRIGTLYAEAFPRNVRAMILDGAVEPGLGLVDRRLYQYTGFQRSFEQMAADCAKRPDCPLGAEPSKATKIFQESVRPLLKRPVPAGDGRRLSYDDAINAVVSGLYSREAWPVIIAGLAEVRAGRGDKLLRLREAFSPTDGSGGNFAEANYAIACMDEERLTPQQAGEFKDRIHQVAPFMDSGSGVDGARDGCEFWPAEPKPAYPLPDRVEGVAPTLTISITGDPSTPYDAGVKLADVLGGKMLTVDGEQHTILSSGKNACVNDIAATYLTTLRMPADDSRCAL